MPRGNSSANAAFSRLGKLPAKEAVVLYPQWNQCFSHFVSKGIKRWD